MEEVNVGLTRLLKEMCDGSIRMDRINLSQIVQIPKKDTPVKVDDYRSIALLNNSLKITSKVLANILAPMMSELIRDYQTGFIKERSILESVATTMEVIYQCKKPDKDGYLLKLDFHKAYDMVDWNCLLKVLKARGFGAQ